MRRAPRWLAVIIMVVLAVGATGCWDWWEIEDRGFVMGIAMDLGPLDRGPGGKTMPIYRVTLQMAQPTLIAGKGGTGGMAGGGESSNGGAYWNLTAGSISVKEAVRQMVTRSDRRPYFEDTRVIVIGEDLARRGIAEAMDYWSRHDEVRWKVLVYVAADEARKVLTVTPRQEPLNAIYLANLARNDVTTMRVSPTKDVGMVVRALYNDTPFVLPRVEAAEDEVKLAGSAVFKHGRLVGWLDDFETGGLRILRDQVSGGTLPLSVRGAEYVLDVTELRTRLYPRYRDGVLSFQADIRVEATVGEDQSLRHETGAGYFAQIQQAAAAAIKTRVDKALTRAQQDLNVDVFNFGREVEIRYPRVWKQIAGRWDEIFPTVEVDVRPQVYIRRIGVIR